MTTSVDITPEQRAELSRQAAARGVDFVRMPQACSKMRL
jgi:hypothetical protein